MARDGTKAATSGVLAATGLGSALALASCCVFPMCLAALGLGSSWLVPVAKATEPHSGVFWAAALLSIPLSVLSVAVASRTCTPGGICARRGFRLTIYGLAALSLVPLIVRYFFF